MGVSTLMGAHRECFNAQRRHTRAAQETAVDRKFLIAWLLTFVAWMAESFVVHGLMLGADYSKLATLFRPEAEAQNYFPIMLGAHVIMAAALVWIYRRGLSAAADWAPQGLRFGLAVVLLTIAPTYLIYYCVQPLPGALVVKQIIYDGVGVVLVCLVVAWLHRDKAALSRV